VTPSRAEQNVKTASDLYEARRAARFLLRDSYAKSLQPFREFIGKVMKAEGLSVLQAALKVGQSIPPSDPIPLMCLMAAAVDMCEEGL
jgi:hypothetical protein